MKKLLLVVFSLVLIACSQTENLPLRPDFNYTDRQTGRWYSVTQVQEGQAVYGDHCAACHGLNAESTPDWKNSDENGVFPPPPLDGSAHAWHHSFANLKNTLKKGGAEFGGVMPAFEGILTEEEMVKVLASIQNYWPDKTYDIWLERELN